MTDDRDRDITISPPEVPTINITAAGGPPGIQGPQGPPGPALNFRGSWQATVAYDPGDTVESGGQVWVALTASTGVEPGANPAEWVLLDSTPGPPGPPGPAGPGFVLNVADHGVIGDGATDNTSVLVDLLDRTPYGSTLFWPAGVYLAEHLSVEKALNWVGEDRRSTVIRNSSTDGGVFVYVFGASTIRNLTLDGQREAQNALGLSTIIFGKPGRRTAGGNNGVSGALILAAPVTAGDMTLTVTVAEDFIHPGDIITLTDGTGLYEDVKVTPGYVPGSSVTVPLVDPTIYNWNVMATVTAAVTGPVIRDCTVYSNGRDGITFWRCVDGTIADNLVSDGTDTKISLPSGGNRRNLVTGNVVDSIGRYGIGLDEQQPQFWGATADNIITNNRVVPRYSNFTDLGGASTLTVYGIGVGQHCDRTLVADNSVDVSHCNNDIIGAIWVHCAGGLLTRIIGNHINGRAVTTPALIGIGSPRTGGYSATDNQYTIANNDIHNITTGIQLDATVSATVVGNVINNCTSFAININYPIGSAVIQRVTIMGNYMVGTYGFRFGGPNAPAGTAALLTGNVAVVTGSPYVADTPAVLVRSNNIPSP